MRLPGLGLIVCSAPGPVAERVRGLRNGADDWITKPCHPDELTARLEAILRRRRAGEGPSERETITAGELAIRPDRFDAYVGDTPAGLSRKEYELLSHLATAGGRVLEREDIYHRVWGYTMARGDRSVDVFVRKLRHKLEQVSPDWRYVHTHFGVGYRFAAESDRAVAPPPAAEPAPRAGKPEPAAQRLEPARA
jgi:DNA-binding response OmpR family regulator